MCSPRAMRPAVSSVDAVKAATRTLYTPVKLMRAFPKLKAAWFSQRVGREGGRGDEKLLPGRYLPLIVGLL